MTVWSLHRLLTAGVAVMGALFLHITLHGPKNSVRAVRDEAEPTEAVAVR